MATRIYLGSAEGGTGKSTVAVGLVETLRRTVDRVGVFRPIARSTTEPDYVLQLLLEHATPGLSLADCIGTDYQTVHDDPDGALATILDRIGAIESCCDAILVLGSDYTDVSTPTELAENARIAAALAAPVILVVNGRRTDGDGARTPEEIAEAASIALAQLRAEHAEAAALVVSRVDPDALDATSRAIAASPPAAGLAVWTIPEDQDLIAPLLRTMLEHADAELLMGDPKLLDRPVRGTVIAAMTMENVLPRLIEGSIVVVPGDRSDVLLGAAVAHLSTTFPSLAGVVLNGGFPLASSVERLLVGLSSPLPIARNALGTYDTAVRLAQTRSRLAADSPQKYLTALALFDTHVDGDELVARLRLSTPTVMTPQRFEHELLERARSSRRHIVLPEGNDDRILQAAAIVTKRGIAELTILGDDTTVRGRAAELGLDLTAVHVLSPLDPVLHERFAREYLELRAKKGISAQFAADTVTDVAYFGTMMVHDGLADGMVSGAAHTTAHTIRPAFEIVKTSPGVDVVSSVFLMALADRVLVYGDCAVIPEPTVDQLADIAISSAATARRFGIEPRVAMLSYSSGESGSGTEVERVRQATELVKKRAPELKVVGPIQYDAAADPTVGASKMPGSDVAGHATVFVFPDLNTGNNTYKAVQRSSGALAIGPVLQGLAKPINDLSRGALVRDIVNTIAITAIQAQDAPTS
ncbi:MAG: phosphate acetyltransferase [Pseudolysinimonas sp.]